MSLDAKTLSQLVSTVARFVDERLIPLEHEVAEADAIPSALIKSTK